MNTRLLWGGNAEEIRFVVDVVELQQVPVNGPLKR